ncbi:unnamed protein product [Schistosoma turkestanicum]|nr:unnamed protein product [Schistosoma turkestanicum]
MFFCCHLNPAVVWNLQLSAPGFVTTCIKNSGQFIVQSLFDPFLVFEEGISFRKVSLICDTVYCLALSYSGQLFLFNMFASVCLGCLNQFPRVHDFYICPKSNQSTLVANDECPGFHEITIVILRDLEENDQPPPSGPTKLLELVLFPSYQVIYQIHISDDSWLLSDYDVGSYKIISSDAPILYAELLSKSPSEATEDFLLSIKGLKATDPKERLLHLLKSEKFEEARLLVKTFNLDSQDFQLVLLTELEFLVNTIYKDDQNNDLFYQRLIICLQQTEELWKNLEIVASVLKITMPKSDDQLKLLLIVKEKLTMDNPEDMSTAHEDIGIKVLILLKRFKAFLMIYGSDSYTPETWIEFRDANVYAIFARLFLSKSPSAEDRTSDPSQAFLFWILYKGELSEYLTWDTLELLFDLLSKRPLTCIASEYSCNNNDDDDDDGNAGLPYQSNELELLESEEAIQKWIRNELLPVVIRRLPEALPMFAKYLTQRVKELEACSFTSNSNSHVQESKIKCPFSWPSTAISWINKFLDTVNISELNSAECYLNIGSIADLYLSGLASRNPDVDPFYELRKLSKQLDTIKLLRDVYNCQLSIDCCEGETELSIAYRILDVAFNLGTRFENGVDKLTARYLKDRNIDYETFFQGYSSDLINRIQTVIHSSIIDDNCPADQLGSPKCKQSRKNQDPHVLAQQACLVASWITVPSCRMKVVFDLASVAPLPWSGDLITLAESILKQARIPGSCSQYVDGLTHKMNKLERLCNIARLHEIFTRYELKEFSLSDVGYANSLWLADQVISRILRSSEGPFGTNTPFATPQLTRSDPVYHDATIVAQKLLDQSQWPLLFAQLYMELALFKVIQFKELETTNYPDDYENRISFFIIHLNFATNEALNEFFSGSGELEKKYTSQFIFIKNWLIRLAFRSMKQLLKHGDVLLPFQHSLIVDLGLSLASMKITFNSIENVKNCSQMSWRHLMQFTKLYITPFSNGNNLNQPEISIFSELFSNNKCVFGLLTDRLYIIRRLTKFYIEQIYSSNESVEVDKLFNVPVKLRSSYHFLLPDLPYGIREELITWQWFSSLCSTICSSSIETTESCSESNLTNNHSLFLSKAMQIQLLLVKMSEVLISIHQTRLHSSLGKIKSEVIENPSIYSYLVPTCCYCSCIWNRPLARLGCIIELFILHVFPFLLKIVKSMQLLDETSAYNKSIVNIISIILSTFSSLLLWSSGQDHLNPVIEQKCICRMFALANEFQALRLVVQAFTNVFNQIDCAYQQSKSCDKDLLECVFYTSLYHEQTTTDIVHLKLQSNHFTDSLQYLTNLLKWFTCHYSYDDNNKVDDNTRNEEKIAKTNYSDILHQILEEGMKLASTWSSEFGLHLTGSHTLLIGIVNLIRSCITRSIWSDSFIFDLGLQELNNDTINNCFNLCNKCLSSSLSSILNPSDGKYLDQPLALSLALALPIDEATSVVRNFVAQNKHAPKKIMAVANIIFMFSQITCKRDLSLLELSQTMGKMWSWHIVLKPYKLNFSRIITNGMDHSSLQHILDKLCRMVPSLNEQNVSLVPSDLQSNESMSRRFDTTTGRSLPSVRLIARFSNDFNIPLKPYLIKHLNCLFKPCSNSSSSTVDADGDFLFTGLNNNDNMFLSTSPNVINGSEVNCFIRYQKICLSRAHTILRLLFRLGKQSDNPQHALSELINLLQSFYASTSPYDYERLSFLFSWIRTCCSKTITNKQLQLLNFLRTYKRSHPPRDFELECVSATAENETIIFSKSEGHHYLSNIRMPYHLLLNDSLPIKIVGPEITVSNVNFWLRVNQSMEWNSSDLIKITAAQNLATHYTTIGLLPIANSNYATEDLTVPRSVGWDRALPCQILIEPLFSQLNHLLGSVKSTLNVYSLLAGLARRVIYGPHRLLILRLARDLAKSYLLRADNEARLLYARNKLSCSNPNNESSDSDTDEGPKEAQENIRLARIALEKAETSHKQFAIEGCLYEHHLADWEEVNKHFNSPFELILNLLHKAASELQSSVNWNCRSGLPISELFLRRRVIKALPRIAELAHIDLLDIAKHVMISRLKLPRCVFMNNGDLNESSITNRSLLLDMTTECGEFSPNDISFNATMHQPQFNSLTSLENQGSEQLEPKQEDFMLAELLLQQTELKQELLPVLEFFVFSGNPDQFVSARWRAARCILRCQSGLILRPKLSLSELRCTLLRLSTLASCPNAASQQLLFDASFSCTSSRGDTYNLLCCTRLINSIKQLMVSSNSLQTIRLASGLVLDYELLSPPIITQLFEFINSHSENESLDYTLFLLIFLQSSGNVNESMKWFFSNPVKQGCMLHYLLSSLAKRMLLKLLSHEQPIPRKVGNFLSKLVCILISWPFPDTEIEAIFSELSKLVSPMFSKQTVGYDNSLQRIPIIIDVFQRLLALGSSNKHMTKELNTWFNLTSGSEEKPNMIRLVHDAIQASEICLTSKFLSFL